MDVLSFDVPVPSPIEPVSRLQRSAIAPLARGRLTVCSSLRRGPAVSNHPEKGGTLNPGDLQTPGTKAVAFPNRATSIGVVVTSPSFGKIRVCPQEVGSLGRGGM